MTDPYHAMCAELLLFSEEAGEICMNESLWPKSDPTCTLQQRARALLAQPEPKGPTDEELRDMADFDCDFDRYDTTDSDGREGVSWECSDKNLVDYARAVLAHWGRPTPQPVAVGPTDEEIMELMPQQRRDDLAAAASALAWRLAITGFERDSMKAVGVCRVILNRYAVDHVRAVLDKWGNQ